MVLYIDFEWETEPLKMALSKNFTLPEKCKNRRRAPRVDSRIDQTVFDSKLFGSSLISQRDWRGGRLLARKKGEIFFLLFCCCCFFLFVKLPLPPPPAPEARRRANSCRWTFKFTLNEEQTKMRRKKKSFWHKGRRKQIKRGRRRRGGGEERKKKNKWRKESEGKHLVFVFISQKKNKRNNSFFCKNRSLSLSFSLSLHPSKVVFHYINAAITSYSHWFVFRTLYPPHPDLSCR